MALFQKASPERALTTELTKLRAKRADIARQISEIESDVLNKQADARQLVMNGSPDELVLKAEVAHSHLETSVRNRNGALNQIDGKISEIEAQLDAITDQKERKEAIAQIGIITGDLNSAALTLIDAARGFADAAGKASPIIIDAVGLKLLGERLGVEIPDAVAFVASLLRSHAAAIENGAASAKLARPEPALAPAPAPPTPTRTVYTIKPLIWTDAESGFELTRPSHAQVKLDPHLAERAIAVNAAWDIADPRVATTSRNIAPKYAAPSQCISLDLDGGQAESTKPDVISEPVLHSAFGR